MRRLSKSGFGLFVGMLLLVSCQGAGDGETAVFVPTPQPLSTPTQPPLISVPTTSTNFEGNKAMELLVAQTDMGPRWPGSDGHLQVREFIQENLAAQGWQIEQQSFDYQGFAAMNIIGRANVGKGRIIILGAHYDTRLLADQSEDGIAAQQPVPGGIDGASGVAVLLELARTLDLEEIDREIWLTFFDVEDNGFGSIPNWDYIAGSTYMASTLEADVEAVVVVDMVGQKDQTFYLEGYSHPGLQGIIWDIAIALGYGDQFIKEQKYSIIDDHLPFVQQGIVAIDIIDFDYEQWHTVEDDADKASAANLESVGRTLEVWLEDHLGN